MKFKYSAFIENTPEMREWLESIGYEVVKKEDLQDRDIIRTGYPKGNIAIMYYNYHVPYLLSYAKDIIDCRSNPQLFKAITAVRDDSDKDQWFYNEFGEWDLCKVDHLKFNDVHIGGQSFGDNPNLAPIKERLKEVNEIDLERERW